MIRLHARTSKFSRRAMILVLAALIFFLALGDRRPRAIDSRSRGSSPMAVWQALTPLRTERLWADVAAARTEGRIFDVVAAMEAIARLEPENTKLTWYLAYTLAYDLAQNEVDVVARWRFYDLALRRLAEGVSHDPDDFLLNELSVRILDDLIADDTPIKKRFEDRHGSTPRWTALTIARSLASSHADSPYPLLLVVRTAERAAADLVRNGRDDEAAAFVGELGAIVVDGRQRFGEVFASTPLPSRLAAEAELLRHLALVRGELQAAPASAATGDSAASSLVPLLERFADEVAQMPLVDAAGDGATDASLTHRIFLRCMHLAQFAAERQFPRVALLWMEPVCRIARLAEGRLGPRMPYYAMTYVDELGRFLSLDAELLQRAAAGQVPTPEEEAEWNGRLQALDALVSDVDRAGRSDGFARRLEAARRSR